MRWWNLWTYTYQRNLCIQIMNQTRQWKKEGNGLINDTLNTFYLWLYGVRHKVKDHSDNERRNLLLPLYGLLFSISSKASFISTIPKDSTYHSLILVVEHWVESEIAQWVHHDGLIRWVIAPWANALPSCSLQDNTLSFTK